MAQALLDALPLDYKNFANGVTDFACALLQRRLFPAKHPSVETKIDQAYESLDSFLRLKDSVVLRIVGSSICYLNFKIDITKNDDKAVLLLRETLKRMAIGEIEFDKGFTKDELAALLEILNHACNKDHSSPLSEAWPKIDNIKIRNRLQGTETERNLEPERSNNVPEIKGQASHKSPAKEISKMGKLIEGILGELEKIRSPEGKLASKKILEIVENESSNASTILLLNSLRTYDDYTFCHSVNVSVISTAIAKHVGFEDDEIEKIGIAGLLHDIGKLYVPKEIIHKTGKLNPAEWRYVKRHPVDGEKILREERADPLSVRVSLEHHMRYDRQGYPVPKKDYVVSEASHIVRIADSYDALTTKRPYRRQINPYEAVRFMYKYRGHEFHPSLFDMFMLVLGNIPIGSVLEIESGETVLVIDMGKGKGETPKVRILKDADGNTLEKGPVLSLDELGGRTRKEEIRIREVLDTPVRDINVGRYLAESD